MNYKIDSDIIEYANEIKTELESLERLSPYSPTYLNRLEGLLLNTKLLSVMFALDLEDFEQEQAQVQAQAQEEAEAELQKCRNRDCYREYRQLWKGVSWLPEGAWQRMEFK